MTFTIECFRAIPNQNSYQEVISKAMNKPIARSFLVCLLGAAAAVLSGCTVAGSPHVWQTTDWEIRNSKIVAGYDSDLKVSQDRKNPMVFRVNLMGSYFQEYERRRTVTTHTKTWEFDAYENFMHDWPVHLVGTVIMLPFGLITGPFIKTETHAWRHEKSRFGLLEWWIAGINPFTQTRYTAKEAGPEQVVTSPPGPWKPHRKRLSSRHGFRVRVLLKKDAEPEKFICHINLKEGSKFDLEEKLKKHLGNSPATVIFRLYDLGKPIEKEIQIAPAAGE